MGQVQLGLQTLQVVSAQSVGALRPPLAVLGRQAVPRPMLPLLQPLAELPMTMQPVATATARASLPAERTTLLAPGRRTRTLQAMLRVVLEADHHLRHDPSVHDHHAIAAALNPQAATTTVQMMTTMMTMRMQMMTG